MYTIIHTLKFFPLNFNHLVPIFNYIRYSSLKERFQFKLNEFLKERSTYLELFGTADLIENF